MRPNFRGSSWKHIEVTGCCWYWRGRINADGYGLLANGFAHRRVYLELVGTIPDGLEADHICRQRNCVNPDHIEFVTHAENMRRSSRKNKNMCHRGHILAVTGTVQRGNRVRCKACEDISQARYRATGRKPH